MDKNIEKTVEIEEVEVETKPEETKKKFELPKPVKTGLKWAGVAALTVAGFMLGEKVGENRAFDEIDLEVIDLDETDEI